MSIGLSEFTKQNAKQQLLGKRHDATRPQMQPLSPVRILLSRPCNSSETSPRTLTKKDMDDKDAVIDYEPTSAEAETDAESPAKRQRPRQLRRGHFGVQGAVVVLADEPARGETLDAERIAESIKQIYESLNRLCDKEALKFFIESLDKKFKKKVQRDVRRTERRNFGKSKADVAEVYSPLRVCATARKMGLKAGFSFDHAVNDKNGEP